MYLRTYVLFQARVLCNVPAEQDIVQFLIGTQTLKFENQVRTAFGVNSQLIFPEILNPTTWIHHHGVALYVGARVHKQ